MNEPTVIEMLKNSKTSNIDLWEAWELQHMRLDRIRAMFGKAHKKGLPIDNLLEHLDNALNYINNIQKELR